MKVVVVDDGSSGETTQIVHEEFSKMASDKLKIMGKIDICLELNRKEVAGG